MSTTYATIQALLDTHLLALGGLPTLQRENTANVGRTGQPWSRATLLPARKSQVTVGNSGRDQISGIYQVDLAVAQDTGTSTVNALADLVVDHFPRGFTLTSGGVTVHVKTASRLPGARFEPFYRVPVQIDWYAIT